jgi:hypothetical protein
MCRVFLDGATKIKNKIRNIFKMGKKFLASLLMGRRTLLFLVRRVFVKKTVLPIGPPEKDLF